MEEDKNISRNFVGEAEQSGRVCQFMSTFWKGRMLVTELIKLLSSTASAVGATSGLLPFRGLNSTAMQEA